MIRSTTLLLGALLLGQPSISNAAPPAKDSTQAIQALHQTDKGGRLKDGRRYQVEGFVLLVDGKKVSTGQFVLGSGRKLTVEAGKITKLDGAKFEPTRVEKDGDRAHKTSAAKEKPADKK